jgi:hypothetical protein
VNLKAKNLKNTSRKLIFPVISAQVISTFLAQQLTSSERLKGETFKLGLLSGIASLTTTFLKELTISTKAVVLGLKVECSGKWQQTTSGRKQKLLFSIGSLKAQSASHFVSFGLSTVSTKFGACTVKVWLCYRPISS